MSNFQPLAIVVRIPEVSIPRADLERALGVAVDRYEPSKYAPFYAQIDIEERDQVSGALEMLEGKIDALASNGSIGSVSLDIALAFPDNAMSVSTIIPSDLIRIASRLGFALEVSIYRTTSSSTE